MLYAPVDDKRRKTSTATPKWREAVERSNAARSNWTEDRAATLRRLWAEGLSCSIIAERMGITRNAVIGKVHRLRLSGRNTVIRAPSQKQGGRWRRKRDLGKPGQHQEQRQSRRSVLASLPVHPLPPPAETDIARVAFADLEPKHCRWPISAHPHGPVHGYCGCDHVPGLPYCADHARRAYRVPDVRPRGANERHGHIRGRVKRTAALLGVPATEVVQRLYKVDLHTMEVMP